MSTILIFGGYGGFGARLSRRLAAAGHAVVVAGRRLARAEAFCAAHPPCRPLQADRGGAVAPVLERVRPDLVIDAAGPFQGSGYELPRACIAAAIPYLDLADGRAFVAGIGELDDAARAAGVAILAGASSVPALSGAAARRIGPGDGRGQRRRDRHQRLKPRDRRNVGRRGHPELRGQADPALARAALVGGHRLAGVAARTLRPV